MVRRKQLHLLLTSQARSPPTQRDRTKWIRLPYFGRHSNRLATILKRQGYLAAFKPVTTINSLFSLKDQIPKEKQPGVYKLTCDDCGHLYIGQTGRKFSTRLSDHQTAYNTKKPGDSAVAKHCLDAQHGFEKISWTILHSCSKGRLMNHLEEVETVVAQKLYGGKLLNDLTATFVSPIIRHLFDYANRNLMIS